MRMRTRFATDWVSSFPPHHRSFESRWICSRGRFDTCVRASHTEAEKIFKQGAALGEEGKWDEAAVLIRAGLVADPTYNAWCYLGFAEFNNAGEYCEASVEPYTRCLQHNPTVIAAHINLAVLLLHVRRDVDGAERLFRSALELDPESPDAHEHLSLLLEQERGDLDGAIAEMEGLLRCGENPGFNGEAKLVSLKEKKTKAQHAVVRTSPPPPPPLGRVFCFVHPLIVLSRFLPVYPPLCLSDMCRHLSLRQRICSRMGLRSARRKSGPRRSCRSTQRFQRT